MKPLSDAEEEILESFWVELQENKNQPDLDSLKDDSAFNDLVEKGYIDLEKKDLLTSKGFEEAKKCIRRHRLAERLVADILDVKDSLVHETGCKFEHGLHYGVEDNICILLGHPKTCTHGKPIPPGDCCKSYQKDPKRMIVSLKDMQSNDKGKVSYLNTHDKDVLKKLISMGILPGSQIKLLHRYPSFVFDVGSSTFAIDEELAEHIFVLKFDVM